MVGTRIMFETRCRIKRAGCLSVCVFAQRPLWARKHWADDVGSHRRMTHGYSGYFEMTPDGWNVLVSIL